MTRRHFNIITALLFCTASAGILLVRPHASPVQITKYGDHALDRNTTGTSNAAFGVDALAFNTGGSENTAMGIGALTSSIDASSNAAAGYFALHSDRNGYNNAAVGAYALAANDGGANNTACGARSLEVNTSGASCTALGSQALCFNQTGTNNTGSGGNALYTNATGSNNSAYGAMALSNATGDGNIGIGKDAGKEIKAGSNNIAIGNVGSAGDSGAIRIGMPGTQHAAYLAGISGVTSPDGVQVFINSSGQLGTVTSSRRFKNKIRDMDSASEKLMRLRPVTFHYKQAAGDGSHPLQYGLIAEEVAKVYPNLVQYDRSGKPFSIYYHLLTPMLLNELQRAHRQILTRQCEDAALRQGVAAQVVENTALKAELAHQSAELNALKQVQQQQAKALARLTALVGAPRGNSRIQQTALTKP